MRVHPRSSAFVFCLLLLIAIATTMAPPEATATISFVQGNSAVPPTPQSSVTVSYMASQIAGDLNVVVVGWSDATAVVTSVSDTKGNVYTRAVGPTVLPGPAALSQAMYYAKNIVAAPAGGNTVTVTFNVSAVYPDIRILEYSGVDPTNPLDVTVAAPGNGATSDSGAVTTTNANDLLVAANTVQTTTQAAGAGFTNRMITSPDGDIVEDRVVSATGSYRATAPLSSAGTWVMQMVVFKAAAGVSTSDPSKVGQWAGPFTWPIVAVHMVLLPTGKILAWDLVNNAAQVWDPATENFTDVTDTAVNFSFFCAGQTALADGRVLVDGGHINYDVGSPQANAFNPTTLTWSPLASMAFGRWYPTVITLSDGRVLAVSGHTTCSTCVASIPEVYDPAANTWRQLPGAQSSSPTQYPHLFVLPDGRVVEVASSEEVIPTRVLDVASHTWTTVDPRSLDGGSSVMYEPGKVMKAGAAWDDGVANPANTTYVLDMTQPAPVWRQTSSMTFVRVTHNLTLLADGTVLATGGSSNSNVSDLGSAVYDAELWSPTTEAWTVMAGMLLPRVYHSTALLLPDGRVLEAGSGRFGGTGAGVDQLSAEIYSPPYLFKGARPTITSAPTTLAYGSTFSIATPDAARIAMVSLVRLGSVTHAFNSGQRFLSLTFQQVSGGLSVTAPINANVAPPGYYMLFIVDTNGVPSIAPFVRFPATADTTPPTAPSSLTATATSSSQINLAWTPSTSNVGVVGYRVERCQGAGCSTFTQVATATGTTYGDTGLLPATSYSYRVRATDAAGNFSPYSNIASAITLAPAATISFVQGNSAVPPTPQSSVTVSYMASQIAGDLNVVVVGWSDATAVVTSVSDTKGNVYTRAVGPTVLPGPAALSQAMYYAKNIVAAPAGGNTVTVTFNVSAVYPDIRILEYSGVDPTNPLDVTVAAPGNGATSDSGAVTTTNANDLLVAANTVQTTTQAAGAGFTNRMITSPDGDIVEDRVVSATGSYRATAPLSSAGTWVMQMVAFQAARR